jgi:hypothetical protein
VGGVDIPVDNSILEGLFMRVLQFHGGFLLKKLCSGLRLQDDVEARLSRLLAGVTAVGSGSRRLGGEVLDEGFFTPKTESLFRWASLTKIWVTRVCQRTP